MCIGGKVVSIDPSDWANKIARQIVEHAGLSDRVDYMVTTSTEAIPQLKAKYGVDHLELVFIDHVKEIYLQDLKLMEQHSLIASGTVLVADNVIWPGTPDYLGMLLSSSSMHVFSQCVVVWTNVTLVTCLWCIIAYVRGSPLYTTVFHDSFLEYSTDKRDGVEVSIRR